MKDRFGVAVGLLASLEDEIAGGLKADAGLEIGRHIAVIRIARILAVDHGSQGIRVNCVAPGPVYTPMVYGRGMSDKARAQRAAASVLCIEGTGWDIGHAVRFLASDHARYITGQVLVVDGGTTLRAPERDNQS